MSLHRVNCVTSDWARRRHLLVIPTTDGPASLRKTGPIRWSHHQASGGARLMPSMLPLHSQALLSTVFSYGAPGFNQSPSERPLIIVVKAFTSVGLRRSI